MIERYTLPEMAKLWSLETKFQKWLEVEIAVCEVHAEEGVIPTEALEQIKTKAQVLGRICHRKNWKGIMK